METLKKSTYLVLYKTDESTNDTHKLYYDYESNYNIGSAQYKQIVLCKLMADLVLEKKVYNSTNDMPPISEFNTNTVVHILGNHFPIYILNRNIILYIKWHSGHIYNNGQSLRNSEVFFRKRLTINDAIGLTAFTVLVTWLLYEITKK